MRPRTDPHRPSALEPADYEWIGSYPPLGADPNKNWLFVCAHCGHNPCLWGEVYRHKPTGEEIVVGRICAEHSLDYPDRARMEAAKSRRAFETARVRNTNREHLQNEAPEIADWLDEILSGARAEGFDFVHQLAEAYNAGRPFSDQMIASLRRCLANSLRFEEEKRREAEYEAAGYSDPFPSGRQMVTGDILSVKAKDGRFGVQLKMRVRLPRGNTAWGTVPSNLREKAGWDPEDEYGPAIKGLDIRGERVRFAAEFEVSQDDPHFGYFSRPARAELIDMGADLISDRLRTSSLAAPQLSSTDAPSLASPNDKQPEIDI